MKKKYCWTKRSVALMMALALVLSAVPQNLAFAKEVSNLNVNEETEDEANTGLNESVSKNSETSESANEAKLGDEKGTKEDAGLEKEADLEKEAGTEDEAESEEVAEPGDETGDEDETETEDEMNTEEEAESLGVVADGPGTFGYLNKYYKTTTSYGVTGYPVLVALDIKKNDIDSLSVENMTLSLEVDGVALTVDKSRVKYAGYININYGSVLVNLGYFNEITEGEHDLEVSVTLKGKNGTDYKYDSNWKAEFLEDNSFEAPEAKTVEIGGLNAVENYSRYEGYTPSVYAGAEFWGPELSQIKVTSITAVGSKDGIVYGKDQGTIGKSDRSKLIHSYPTRSENSVYISNRYYMTVLDENERYPGSHNGDYVHLNSNVPSDMVLDMVFYSGTKEVYRIKDAAITVGKKSTTKIITDRWYRHSLSVNIAGISTDNSKQYISYYVYGKNLTKDEAPVFYSQKEGGVVVASMDKDDPNCGVDTLPKYATLDVVMFTLKKNVEGEAGNFWNNIDKSNDGWTTYAEFSSDITHVDKEERQITGRLFSEIFAPEVYNVIECKNSARIYFVDGFASVGDSITVELNGYDTNWDSISGTENARVADNNGQLFVEVTGNVYRTIKKADGYKLVLKKGDASISSHYAYRDDCPWTSRDDDYNLVDNVTTLSTISVKSGQSWEIHDMNHATKAIYTGTAAPSEDQIKALADTGEMYRVCIKDSEGYREQVNYVYFKAVHHEKYQITYDLAGGNWPEGYTAITSDNPDGQYSTVYTKEDGGVLGTPEKVGYEFVGWYAGSTKITKLKGLSGNKNLVAHWTPAKYTIEFYPNGGTGSVYKQVISYDQKTSLTPNKFKRTDYGFVGWSTSPDGNKQYDDKQLIDKDFGDKSATVKLYATWTSYKVEELTFDFEKGSYKAENNALYFDSAEVVEECKNNDKFTFKVTAVAKSAKGDEVPTKLVWTSEDKTIAAVVADASDSHQATITIPKKANGIVTITVTAQDSGKLAESFSVYVKDYTPIIPNKTAAINSWAVENTASIRTYPAYGSSLKSDSLMLLQSYKNGTATEWKELEGISLSVDGNDIRLTTTRLFTENSKTFANLKLTGEVINTESGDLVPFEVSGITVNIKNSSPAVTITQVASNSASGAGKNFNLFYKNETAAIKFTAKGAKVKDVSIVADGEADPNGDGKETFKAYNWDQENQILTITYQDESVRPASLDKKLVFRYEIEGYNPEYIVDSVSTNRFFVSKPLTIATEYKKPVLEQSRTSTIFSAFCDEKDPVKYYVWTKGAEKTEANALTVNLPSDVTYITYSNNHFDAVSGQVVKNKKNFYYFGQEGITGKASASVKLVVSNENWMETIPVSHTFSLNAVAPSVKLTNNKTKASVNNKFYTADTLGFALTPSNIDSGEYVEYAIKRLDSGNALAQSENLDLSVDEAAHTINVKIADGKTVAKGNYRFALICTAKDGTKLKDSGLKIKDVSFTVSVVDTLPVITLKPATSTVNLMTQGIAGTSAAELSSKNDYNVTYQIVPDTNNKLTESDLHVVINESQGEITALLGENSNAKANVTYKYRVKAIVSSKNSTMSEAPSVELTRDAVFSVKVTSSKPSLVVKQVQGKGMDVGKGQPLTYTVSAFKNVPATSAEIFKMEYVLEQYEYKKNDTTKKMEYVLIEKEDDVLFTLSKTEQLDKKGNPTGIVQLEVRPKNPVKLSSTSFYYIKFRAKSDFKGIAAKDLSTKDVIRFKPSQTAFAYVVTGDTVIYRNCTDQTGTLYMTIKNVPEFTPITNTYGSPMIGYNTMYAVDNKGNIIMDSVFAPDENGMYGILFYSVEYVGNTMIARYKVEDATRLKPGKTYSFTLAVMPKDFLQNTKPVNVKLSISVK